MVQRGMAPSIAPPSAGYLEEARISSTSVSTCEQLGCPLHKPSNSDVATPPASDAGSDTTTGPEANGPKTHCKFAMRGNSNGAQRDIPTPGPDTPVDEVGPTSSASSWIVPPSGDPPTLDAVPSYATLPTPPAVDGNPQDVLPGNRPGNMPGDAQRAALGGMDLSRPSIDSATSDSTLTTLSSSSSQRTIKHRGSNWGFSGLFGFRPPSKKKIQKKLNHLDKKIRRAERKYGKSVERAQRKLERKSGQDKEKYHQKLHQHMAYFQMKLEWMREVYGAIQHLYDGYFSDVATAVGQNRENNGSEASRETAWPPMRVPWGFQGGASRDGSSFMGFPMAWDPRAAGPFGGAHRGRAWGWPGWGGREPPHHDPGRHNHDEIVSESPKPPAPSQVPSAEDHSVHSLQHDHHHHNHHTHHQEPGTSGSHSHVPPDPALAGYSHAADPRERVDRWLYMKSMHDDVGVDDDSICPEDSATRRNSIASSSAETPDEMESGLSRALDELNAALDCPSLVTDKFSMASGTATSIETDQSSTASEDISFTMSRLTVSSDTRTTPSISVPTASN